MEPVGDVLATTAKTVAAGAVETGAAVVPVAAATAEGTAAGAVATAAPVAVEAGTASMTTGVAEVPEAVIKQGTETLGESVMDSVGNVAANTAEGTSESSDAAKAVLREHLAQVQEALTAPKEDPSLIYAREQVARRDANPKSVRKFSVPSEIQKDAAYHAVLTRVAEKTGGDVNDETTQELAALTWYYEEAESQLAIKGVGPEVYESKLWGEAQEEVVEQDRLRRTQEKLALTPAEIKIRTYATYLEKKDKEKKSPLKGLAKIIATFFVASGQDASKKLEPDLAGGGQRR